MPDRKTCPILKKCGCNQSHKKTICQALASPFRRLHGRTAVLAVWVLILRQPHLPWCLPTWGRHWARRQMPHLVPGSAVPVLFRMLTGGWVPKMLHWSPATRAVCLLPARRHIVPGLWPHHRFAVSFHIDFKFYYWLLERSRTQGFPSPSILLFPAEGFHFAIFIPWLVTSCSVLYLENLGIG